jgi:hypothetical protein
VASDDDADEPKASNVTAPPAETSRNVVASTEWFTIVNANEIPTAASPVVDVAAADVVAADAV